MKRIILLSLVGLFTVGNIYCQNEIDVSETAFDVTVTTGSITTVEFEIENLGMDRLDYEISIFTDTVLFTKANGADYTLPENQDSISADIIITRGNSNGLFNYTKEDGFVSGSPTGTRWKTGLTVGSAIYSYGNCPTYLTIGTNYSMYIPLENRFFDIYVYEWSTSGVTYKRTETVPWLSVVPYIGNLGRTSVTTITATIDASNTGAGSYESAIVIHSNDSDEGEIIIPVTLTVTGGTASYNSAGSINFGDVTPETQGSQELIITNTGNGILDITNISTETSYFNVSESSLSIFGLVQGSIDVTFEPNICNDYLDTITITSNIGEFKIPLSGRGYFPPHLTLGADTIFFELYRDKSATQPLSLSNLNEVGEYVNWSLPQQGSLPYILANINDSAAQLKASVPNLYEFAYDGGNNYISDGGNDMYDGGNYLNTNFATQIPYSDSVLIHGNGAFGNDGSYFTKNLRGYFIMVAETDSVSEFYITGNNGADGSGSLDTLDRKIEVNGVSYQVITKQIHGTNDPSINHIFILETPDSLTHTYDNTTTNNDADALKFGYEVTVLHYLLVAARESGTGYYLDDVTILSIVEDYLETINAENEIFELPNWLSVSDTEGILLENSSEDLNITVNTTGLTLGNYNYSLLFYNVQQEGLQSVNINLDVILAPPADIEEETFNSEAVSVYPNPASGLLNIEAPIGVSLRIIDATGKSIHHAETNNYIEQIDVSNYAPGLYIIQITNDDQLITKRVAIQ